ncbi:MAG: sulfatase [Armatimonadota bacterium]
MHALKLLLTLLALAFLTLVGGAPLPAGAGGARRPPNILLIVSDDQAWTDYSFMGHPQVRTPHLDRLASQSLQFTRGYTPSSLCCPSLASIITGQYPHQHGVTSNDPPIPPGMAAAEFPRSRAFREGREAMSRLIDRAPTLPRLLGENGYQSLQTGKWWQGDFRRGGFTHGMTRGQRHGDDGLAIGRETLQPVYDFIEDARRREKPFFVWYAPMLPHTPHNPPERLLAKYRDQAPTAAIAKYWAMCEWFDETCGALLEHLDRQGLAEETIVAYVTDNGWIQDPDAERFAPRSKQSPYDGGLRTPTLLRWPGRVEPRRSERPVLSIDLAPTLLQAAGVKPPREMSGIDLLDRKKVETRKTLFGECFTHNAVDLQNPASSLRWRWALRDGWKLILPAPQNEPDGRPELYRVDRDPHEKHNLAEREPERVRALTRALDHWWPGAP